MKNVAIVTGASGWLGARLVESLAEGLPDGPEMPNTSSERPIRALVPRGTAAGLFAHVDGRVHLVEGDLTVPESLALLFRNAQGATVFHCAGVMHPRRVSEYYRVNTEGTKNLIAAARKVDARRIIHVSSSSPIGVGGPPEEAFDEVAPYNPSSHYGKSKMLAERAVWESACSGGPPSVVIRPSPYYGPNQPESQAEFVRRVRTGRATIVGTGENRRSLAYVDNVCQGLLLAEAVERARGQTYWIADARPYAVTEIVDTVELVLARDFGIQVAGGRRWLPGWLSDIAWLADKAVQGVGVYSRRIHEMAEASRTIACRVRKACEELGYQPRVELEEGIRRSVRWMVDHGQSLG